MSLCSNSNSPAACGWLIKSVWSMWSFVCCCPLHPICKCLTDMCQPCQDFPGCSGPRCAGTGRDGGSSREGAVMRVCHFILAFQLLTRILNPVLSISISRWLTKELLSRRQVRIQTAGVSVSLWGLGMNSPTQVWPHHTMPRHHFAGWALNLTAMRGWWQVSVQRLCSSFTPPSPLALCDSLLAIKMLKSFQKLDFTNGKTASAFLRFHIWQP